MYLLMLSVGHAVVWIVWCVCVVWLFGVFVWCVCCLNCLVCLCGMSTAWDSQHFGWIHSVAAQDSSIAYVAMSLTATTFQNMHLSQESCLQKMKLPEYQGMIPIMSYRQLHTELSTLESLKTQVMKKQEVDEANNRELHAALTKRGRRAWGPKKEEAAIQSTQRDSGGTDSTWKNWPISCHNWGIGIELPRPWDIGIT